MVLSDGMTAAHGRNLALHPDDPGATSVFIRDHWTRRPDPDPGRLMPDDMGPLGSAWDCDVYDRATGDCLAYDDRPPVCRDFPWYGREPHHDVWLDMTCSYHGDLRRRVLPLTVLSHDTSTR